MTETRKEIINLISNYMDKTLSEGCIFTKDGVTAIIRYLAPYTDSGKTWRINVEYYNLAKRNYRDYTLHTPEDKTQFGEIIGHYDITAVLKYIGSVGKIRLNCLTFDIFNIQDILLGEIKINKPLHLYSEQEEKELLDLLLKLK